MRRTRKSKWKIDPTVTAEGHFLPKNAANFPGHQRRCQGTTRQGPRAGEQCVNWAQTSSRFCRYHGSPYGRKNWTQKRLAYYKHKAGPALRELLEEMEKQAEKRMSLAEEIDLARILASRSVQIFDKVVMTPPAEGQEGPSDKAKALAREHLRNSIDHVADLVGKYAKVQAMADITLTVDTFEYLIGKVISVVNKTLQDEELADKVAAAIRNIKVPDKTTKSIVID